MIKIILFIQLYVFFILKQVIITVILLKGNGKGLPLPFPLYTLILEIL